MATEVIKTIKSTGGDYTSLEAFLSGEARDLVSADEIAVAEVYISFDYVAMNTTSQAWVTDDTRKIIIRNATDFFHSGKINQGIKLVTSPTTYFLVLQSGHHMLIEGVELTGDSAASSFIYENGASLEVKKCLIHDINGSFSASSGLKLLENCVVWQVAGYIAYGLVFFWYDLTKVVNCSIYADGVGVYSNQIILSDCVCYNTVIYNTTIGGYDNFYSCTGDYNASNDTSAPGTNVIDNITLSNLGWNVSPGSEDLNIGSDSVLIDAGIGHNFNSAIPTTDIAGNERGLDVCTIGAFEYVSGTTSPEYASVISEKVNTISEFQKEGLFSSTLSEKTNLISGFEKQAEISSVVTETATVTSAGTSTEFEEYSYTSDINEIIALNTEKEKTSYYASIINETASLSTEFEKNINHVSDINEIIALNTEFEKNINHTSYINETASLSTEFEKNINHTSYINETIEITSYGSATESASYSSIINETASLSTEFEKNINHTSYINETIDLNSQAEKNINHVSDINEIIALNTEKEKTSYYASYINETVFLTSTTSSFEEYSYISKISEEIHSFSEGTKTFSENKEFFASVFLSSESFKMSEYSSFIQEYLVLSLKEEENLFIFVDGNTKSLYDGNTKSLYDGNTFNMYNGFIKEEK
jgi:hypothetical protein